MRDSAKCYTGRREAFAPDAAKLLAWAEGLSVAQTIRPSITLIHAILAGVEAWPTAFSSISAATALETIACRRVAISSGTGACWIGFDPTSPWKGGARPYRRYFIQAGDHLARGDTNLLNAPGIERHIVSANTFAYWRLRGVASDFL